MRPHKGAISTSFGSDILGSHCDAAWAVVVCHEVTSQGMLVEQVAIFAGIGLAMWALGAVFTGVSFSYGWLLFARIFTGAGALSLDLHFQQHSSCVHPHIKGSNQHVLRLLSESGHRYTAYVTLHAVAHQENVRHARRIVCTGSGRLLHSRAGEASVMTLTGPFIDDVAPPASKARWFAWLSLTPTLGVAIGYKLGDLTEYLSWRVLFYIEAGVAVPVVLFCLLAPAVQLRGKLTQVSPEGRPSFLIYAWCGALHFFVMLFKVRDVAMHVAQHPEKPITAFRKNLLQHVTLPGGFQTV